MLSATYLERLLERDSDFAEEGDLGIEICDSWLSQGLIYTQLRGALSIITGNVISFAHNSGVVNRKKVSDNLYLSLEERRLSRDLRALLADFF